MFTPEFRRKVCVHEAGHAVVYALGGEVIRGLAVAPVGCESWIFSTYSGVVSQDLWGICELDSSGLCTNYLQWEDEKFRYRANRDEYNSSHRSLLVLLGATRGRKTVANLRRLVRLRVCGGLAGPIAEAHFENNEFDVWEVEGWREPTSDVEVAEGLSQLLPFRCEFEHACNVTCETLRRPEIWSRVLALADVLERRGRLGEDEIAEYLPKVDIKWPPSPAVMWQRQSATVQ
jgi:hypothetical protein